MTVTEPTLRDPGLYQHRLIHLIRDSIIRCHLDLSGFTILTEAASGPYAVTPILAAMAGASRVYAVTKSTSYGSVDEIEAATYQLAATVGVADRIVITTEKSREIVSQADVITNSGHVRPIDGKLIGWMKPGSVVPLMYEAWEFRNGDVDLDACEKRGIAVVATNERHPCVDVFSYLGAMATKLLLDAQLAVYGNHALLLCDNSFAPYISRSLNGLGAKVDTHTSLRNALGSTYDVIIVALTPRNGVVIGAADAVMIATRWPQAVVTQFWGDIDRQALTTASVPVWPPTAPPLGHMGVLPSDIGPEPIVRLQCGGLKSAEIVLRKSEELTTLGGIAQRLNLADRVFRSPTSIDQTANRKNLSHDAVSFVRFDEQFCDLSWEWLADEEMRYLTMTPPFTREHQLAWFSGLPDRSDYLIWGIRVDGVPIGALGIKGTGICRDYWGYIGKKAYWDRGLGDALMREALTQARKLNLKKLTLRVIRTNFRAIRLYEKWGFILREIDGDVVQMEQTL